MVATAGKEFHRGNVHTFSCSNKRLEIHKRDKSCTWRVHCFCFLVVGRGGCELLRSAGTLHAQPDTSCSERVRWTCENFFGKPFPFWAFWYHFLVTFWILNRVISAISCATFGRSGSPPVFCVLLNLITSVFIRKCLRNFSYSFNCSPFRKGPRGVFIYQVLLRWTRMWLSSRHWSIPPLVGMSNSCTWIRTSKVLAVENLKLSLWRKLKCCSRAETNYVVNRLCKETNGLHCSAGLHRW